MSMHPNPVFFDKSGKRWKFVVRLFFSLALVLSILGAALCVSIMILPISPLAIKDAGYIHGIIPKLETREEAARAFNLQKARAQLHAVIEKENALHKAKQSAGSSGKPYSTVLGFYTGWNESSYPSLHRHIDSLTHILPEWLTLTPDGKTFDDHLYRQDKNCKKLESLSRRHKVPILVVLTNADKGSFQWPRLKALLQDPDAQQSLAEDVRDMILDKDHRWAGVNLDLETPSADQLSPADQQLVHDAFPKLVATFKSVFGPRKLLVTQDIPAPDMGSAQQLFDYGKLGNINDFIVVMLYDQHTNDGTAGPIASLQWLEATADKIFNQMDSSKVVIGVGNYCYDWPVLLNKDGNIVLNAEGDIDTTGPGSSLSLSSALQIADHINSPVRMDGDDLNPYFTYVDTDNKDHVVFLLDAVTAYNQIQALKDYEPRGAALWYLGSEDPTIWSFFNPVSMAKPVKPAELEKVVYKSEVSLDAQSQENGGKGEVFEVESNPRVGERQLTMNSEGIITSEVFTQYPSSYVIAKLGAADHKVALTFDDGPDPKNTPAILDILRAHHVHGTFFVIGQNVEQYPGLVQQAWADGNDIGNHTFTHPHFPEISKLQAKLQLNATQRAIEGLTGHSTRLFRPPYGEGSDSNLSAADVSVIQEAQDLGYYTVGMNIDPSDYMKPGVDKIVNSVIDQVDNKKWGNVILLHDGGGDRVQTVAALPKIIDGLKKRGYQFVTVSELLGPNMRAQVFPGIARGAEAINGLDQMLFESGFQTQRLLQIIFFISIVLGLLRIVITTPLAIIQARRSKKPLGEDYTPPVTVIIPSYNEGKVICRTIRTVLDSNYPDLQVIVVDDGSTDDTAEVVREEFNSEPRLTFIRKANGGKASALNMGLEETRTEVVVCLDADTVFAKDTIALLARHFKDPKVGAVAGNVKVGNRTNPLTIWQSIEYISSQNFDRRAYSILGSVPVVPGAVGAWQKSAITRAGGYESNTLAEDTDLTFKIQVLGYEIRTENEALAYTEAPDGVRPLAKQRFRWAFGIMQSLWKHRRKLFKRRYGAFSMLVMPSMWLYNIFFQAFSPIVDVMVVLALFGGGYVQVLSYYGAFFVLDMFSAIVAFKLDKESPKQLGWLFWQRFFYRQFMYYVIIKSMIAALRGRHVGWGKLQRKATATLPNS